MEQTDIYRQISPAPKICSSCLPNCKAWKHYRGISWPLTEGSFLHRRPADRNCTRSIVAEQDLPPAGGAPFFTMRTTSGACCPWFSSFPIRAFWSSPSAVGAEHGPLCTDYAGKHTKELALSTAPYSSRSRWPGPLISWREAVMVSGSENTGDAGKIPVLSGELKFLPGL